MPDTFSPTAKLDAYSRIILIRVKIERAKKHLVDLERLLRSRRGHKYANVAVRDDDPNTGLALPPVLRRVRVFPFESLAIAGDVVHNLRSALDHLAYQLVLANGIQPMRDTCFPIGKDFTAYEGMKARCVKGMGASAKKAIDAVKPYGGGNGFLFAIHTLNNIDKHRLMFTVGTDFLFEADWIDDPFGLHTFQVKASKPDFGGVFDRKKEDKIQLKIAKSVKNPQVVQSDSLLPSLHQLVNAVESLTLSFKLVLG